MTNLKFNIKEYGNVKKFIGVYYKWGHDAKGSNEKMTTKDIKQLVDGYEKFIGSGVKFQKTPGATGTTLSKCDIE